MTDELKIFLGKLHTYLDRHKDNDPELAELMDELEPILVAEVMSSIR